MNRTSTVVLLATVFASACAVPGAGLDNVNADLKDALVAGDLELAFDIGRDFVGQPVDDPTPVPRERPDGFVTATFTPEEWHISAADLVGTFVSREADMESNFAGKRLAPVEDQVQGEIYAISYKNGGEEDGEVMASYRASPSGDMGGVNGIWTSSSQQRPLEFQAVYTETAENEGQLFGTYRMLPVPVWTDQLRLRLFADGLSIVEITPDAISIHHIMGVAPGQTGTGLGGKEAKAAAINEQEWQPTWPEQGENLDCDCDSSTLNSGDEGLFAPEAAATVMLHRSLVRGYATVIEQPTSENGFLTRVLINDTNYAGGAWYQMDLAFKK